VLTTNEVEILLKSGHESRGFEIKGPGSEGDGHLFAKVTRAALSLGNHRDGGNILIGISDGDPAALQPGLSETDAEGWLDFDKVSRKMANYSDPPLKIDITSLVLSSGAVVVLIEVAEFDDVPHICAKSFRSTSGKEVLREGALYVRTRKMPETSEVSGHLEMREILDLAIVKALRSYVSISERAGISLSESPHVDLKPYEDERIKAFE
jgi:predicted HTH transcriptional regulator